MADTARLVEPISPDEYLVRERDNVLRHEYVDGFMYAMAGATERHNRIASNLHIALGTHPPDRCVPFMADMKVRVRLEHTERFYCPDCMVCCGPSDQSLDWRDNPIALGEVVSPGTENVDKVSKLDGYKQIPTLEEYIVVEQTKMQIEVYRRSSGWQRELLQANDVLRLASIDFEMPVAAIYRRVVFE